MTASIRIIRSCFMTESDLKIQMQKIERQFMNVRLMVIVPCFNEEQVLPVTAPAFLEELTYLIQNGKISDDSRIMYVNDGSRDRTWDIITSLSEADDHYTGISLSRNRGHQNAVLAGLMEAKDLCDITISIDCDGQDDIHAMEEMVCAYEKGAEIVYGVRNNRDTDSWFKRTSAESYYKLLNKLGAECVYNHADYRLVSSRVLQEFAKFGEVNLFLRGMFPMVGFNSTCVYYRRTERAAGHSHYPLKKMLGFAVDGITSLSVRPIRIITGLGFIVSGVSFIGIIYALVSACVGHAVSGWTSLVCIVCLIGGIQLLSLGVIGEYIGKIYLETKQRPRYIIEKRTGCAN